MAEEINMKFTTVSLYFQLRSQVPQGMCYNVVQGKAKEQLTDVLNYYNVKVTSKDIFSRCQVSLS